MCTIDLRHGELHLHGRMLTADGEVPNMVVDPFAGLTKETLG